MIAKTYANSLSDGVLDDLQTVMTILESSNELKSVLTSPIIHKKQEIIDEVFKNQIGSEVLNLLKILADKGRFNEFENIFEEYKLLQDEKNGIKSVTVISAIELKDKYRTQITDVLSKRINKKVNATWLINPEIIGGLVVKIDDDIIDSGIKNKLDNLRGAYDKT